MWNELEGKLGARVGYRRTGGLNVALDPEDHERLERTAAEQRAAGAEIQDLTPVEAQQLVPSLTSRLAAATYCPTDGYAPPGVAVEAYASAARRMGVRFLQSTGVTSI